MDLSNLFDWSGVEGAVGGVLAEGLKDLLVGAEADLKQYAFGITSDLLRAHLRGDLAWQAELLGQARTLLEINRLRLNAVEWSVAEKVILIVMKAAVAALKGFLPIP